MLASIPYRPLPGFDVGPLTIHVFGLAVAAGVWCGLRMASWHLRERPLEASALPTVGWRVVVWGFLGARAAFVLADLDRYADEPWRMVSVWDGGLQFFGGLVAGMGAVAWWAVRRPNAARWAVADGLALGLAAGLAVGRLGCVAVGEHLGGPTRFWLGLRYLGGDTIEGPLTVGTTVHSTALYEVLGLAVLTGVLAWVGRRRWPEGSMVALFACWYGVQRLATDFLRVYDERLGGLTAAQYVSIALVLAGAVLARRARARFKSCSLSLDRRGADMC